MNPTGRFSDRAQLYAKYRPGYPAEVIEILKAEAGLGESAVVADIGSGTGISTRLFAPHVAQVYGVEPNAEMRREAERESSDFVSVDGTAEATTLPGQSVDFIVAATAFHWFQKDECRREFRRILKPGGWLILVWNMRKAVPSRLVIEYEEVLKTFGTDYQPTLMSQNWNPPAGEFFGAGNFEARTLANYQDFDFEGLKGRLLSASCAPMPGHPNHEPMIVALRGIFERDQIGGRVRLDYDTHLYWGAV